MEFSTLEAEDGSLLGGFNSSIKLNTQLLFAVGRSREPVLENIIEGQDPNVHEDFVNVKSRRPPIFQ